MASITKTHTMAEIIGKQNGKKHAHNLRIDFTPMVDLGFLLISFFMMTTTLAQSKALDLNMPDKTPTENPTAFCEESTVTLIPGAKHEVYWYKGSFKDGVLPHCPIGDLRSFLQKEIGKAANLPGSFSADAHKLHVIIKPAPSSTYADLVQILDEMLINDIGIYVIDDLREEERNKINTAIYKP